MKCPNHDMPVRYKLRSNRMLMSFMCGPQRYHLKSRHLLFVGTTRCDTGIALSAKLHSPPERATCLQVPIRSISCLHDKHTKPDFLIFAQVQIHVNSRICARYPLTQKQTRRKAAAPFQHIRAWHNAEISNAKLPVVTRFFWPPDIPLCIWSPTMVSAHMSSPSICSQKTNSVQNTSLSPRSRPSQSGYNHINISFFPRS